MAERAFKHGVDDLILLEDVSEGAVVDTLKRRYNADLIYTYIGEVLIAINPYRMIPGLYGNKVIKLYEDRAIYEEPPHVYAVAESAYHRLISEGLNQCIIISGESGSGKTETSKFIMQYIASVTGKSKNEHVKHVKDQILESNPCLEAFGNAKTVQNNNSSRFGKYFEIQFDYSGDPVGGRVTNYLLEKSRVVSQSPGERNFHIFYQLLAANPSPELGLTRPEDYRYLNRSNCYTVDGMNDAKEWAATCHALTVVGIPPDEQARIWRLLAAILHLGNVEFQMDGDKAMVSNRDTVVKAAGLLGLTGDTLQAGLCSKEIRTGVGANRRGSLYRTGLSVEESEYSRDALAKAIYSRVFDWLVQRINETILDRNSEFSIGVLDIYGFEIFERNSFEQLTINFVNEKLHQIFIELTLKSEQEEYVAEGIQWESVKYFNNKPCVDLIAGKGGIMAILDEECVFPKGTDESFCSKLNRQCASKPHFEAPSGPQEREPTFTMDHYAGRVTYHADGFLDKNKDQLLPNLQSMMESSNDDFVVSLYPPVAVQHGKRAPTASMQFKGQVNGLVAALMSCQPHYIRCIRPNTKKAGKMFDEDLSRNQVQYLGLLENVRVRRAGYCYRQTFERFLFRYKMINKATWPEFEGSDQEGCLAILKGIGIPEDEFQFGRTKVFIRQPQALFRLEEHRERALHDIAKIIQRAWRRHRNKIFYQKIKPVNAKLFYGNKQRNRETVYRPFYGVYHHDFIKSRVWRVTNKKRNKKLMFVDKVTKISSKWKRLRRTLAITPKSIYEFGGRIRAKLQVRVKIKDITGISMSPFGDDVIVVHASAPHDIVLETDRKAEVATILCVLRAEINGDATPATMADALPVHFVEACELRLRGGKKAQLSWSIDPTATPQARVKKIGAGEGSVAIEERLPPTTGREPPKPGQKPVARSRQINVGARAAKAPDAVARGRAIYDYVAKSARELTFSKGDIIDITHKNPRDTQWQGVCKGRRGSFPASHVQVL